MAIPPLELQSNHDQLDLVHGQLPEAGETDRDDHRRPPISQVDCPGCDPGSRRASRDTSDRGCSSAPMIVRASSPKAGRARFREPLSAWGLSDRGTDETDDTLCMDPFGIQVRVVDRDVPPRWVPAQCRRDDEGELVPPETAGLRVVDRWKRLRRQDVEVEMEP